MKRVITEGLIATATLIGTAGSAGPKGSEAPTDTRVQRLRAFLQEREAPVQHLAHEFVAAADNNQLDWRLLPSISVIESSAGKYHKNNNIFGWANGEKRFPSVRHGIRSVAFQLRRSKYYRNKSVEGILRTYNPNQGYSQRVKRVMTQISPVL